MNLVILSTTQAALLEALLQADTSSITTAPRIVPIQTGEAHPPLFLIHGTGGQVLFLHTLSRHLSPHQPLYGIEAAPSPAPSNTTYAEALRAIQPQGPYRLGGYSAGCLIAFEAATQLRQAGEKIEFLLLIDPVAIPKPTPTYPTPQQKLHRRFELAMLAGVTPLSPEFPRIEQVNRNITTLVHNFPTAPLDHPIHIIHGTSGPYVPTPATLQQWAALTTAGLQTAAIQADHFEIIRDPHAAVTATQIQSWLDALPR